MSIERNPNINAAGLCSDVLESIMKYSRGNVEGRQALNSKKVQSLVTQFCVAVSDVLDEEFGIPKDTPCTTNL